MAASENTDDMKMGLTILSPFLSLCLFSCGRAYEPIEYGKDPCAHCRMTIVDDRYAAELVTGKGRAYKFDDVICMKQFISAQQSDDQLLVFVEDYSKQVEGAIDAKTAIYLQHEFFSSPMNGNYAAFASEADAAYLMDSLKVQEAKWEDL